MKKNDLLIGNIYREEYSKMVAVISSHFGLGEIEAAEDIVSETFLAATANWQNHGIPTNPAGWLYLTAKRFTLHKFRRNKLFTEKVIPAAFPNYFEQEQPIDLDFSGENIKDSQLKMMFAVCDDAISSEAQICLALRILCGFTINEIAEAFLTNKVTINKRLFRAKEKLRRSKLLLIMPTERHIRRRLDNVLRIIYLLFSEGYYSKSHDQNLRKDLCLEALKLGLMLSKNSATNLPETNALIALICFHSSRFSARISNITLPVVYVDQDKNKWNKELFNQGLNYLSQSAEGLNLTSYHIEARIAYLHCIPEDKITKWVEIIQLYSQLLITNYSPGAALNRTYALSKVSGREAAIVEAEKLNHEHNFFYHLLLGDLYENVDLQKATFHFKKANLLARTIYERSTIAKRILNT